MSRWDCPCGNGYQGCDCARNEIRETSKDLEIQRLNLVIKRLEKESSRASGGEGQ